MGIIFLFIIFVINQTVQIINLAHSIHPIFGDIVKYFLIVIYAFLIIISVYQLLHLPKPLKLPDGKDSNDYKEFLFKISNRLVKNKNLPSYMIDIKIDPKEPGIDLAALEDKIKQAEIQLDKQANREIKTTAQTIFVSTAISQSGSLDSLVVLLGQVKMIWRIANIYNQRPALREMIKLYANVAVTSFAARAIEELDFAEIIEPVTRSFGSVGFLNLVPVISIISNSIFSGATNALLTLRTGIITRKYCSLFCYFETREKYRDENELKKYIKTSAIREAGKQLGSVIVTPSQTVLKVLLNGLKKSKDFSGKMVDEMGKAAREMINRIVDFFKRKKPWEEGL
jgi:translation elongation factor EF-1beta